MAQITDDFGRTITSGIDQSDLLKQLADALNDRVGTPTKVGDAEPDQPVLDALKDLPDEIYDRLSDDLADAAEYLKQLVDQYKDKGRQPAKAQATFAETMSRGGGLSAAIPYLSGMVTGVSTLVNLMGVASGHAHTTAKAVSSLEKHATKKGSLYVHDIHVQALLADFQKDQRLLLGEVIKNTAPTGTPNPVLDQVTKSQRVVSQDFVDAVRLMGEVRVPAGTFTPAPTSAKAVKPFKAESIGETGLGQATDHNKFDRITDEPPDPAPFHNIADLLKLSTKYLTHYAKLDKERAALAEERLRDMRAEGSLSDEQLRNLLITMKYRKDLARTDKVRFEHAMMHLDVENASNDALREAIKLSDEYGPRIMAQGKLWADLWQAAKADIQQVSRNVIQTGLQATHAGLDFQKIFEGIGSAQTQHTTALRMALFETAGLTTATEGLRNSYLDASRAAENVAISGQDSVEVMKEYRRNLRLGVRDLTTLNRLTQTSLNLATMIGSNADATADTMTRWHQQTGMTTNQMAQLNRNVRAAGQATGVVGDELLQAVNAAREFADAMRDAGTLSADAAGQFVQLSAATKKYGTERATQPLIRAMSSTVEFYEKASHQTQAFLAQAATSVGRFNELATGTVMNTEGGRRDMVKGMETVLNSFLARFGVTIDEIDKLTAQEKFQLNLQLNSAYGMQLGEAQRMIETFREGTLTFQERLAKINTELAKNLTTEERQALLEQKRGATLQHVLSQLTQNDERVKSAKSMPEALSAMGQTESQARDNLMEAVGLVNEALTRAGKGGQIDLSQVEAALRDPQQYRTLVGAINAAEQKAAVAQKAQQDPIAEGNQKLREINAKIAETTGSILQTLMDGLGPNGAIVASVISAAAATVAGNALITKGLEKAGSVLSSAGSAVGKKALGLFRGKGAMEATAAAAGPAVDPLGGKLLNLTGGPSKLTSPGSTDWFNGAFGAKPPVDAKKGLFGSPLLPSPTAAGPGGAVAAAGKAASTISIGNAAFQAPGVAANVGRAAAGAASAGNAISAISAAEGAVGGLAKSGSMLSRVFAPLTGLFTKGFGIFARFGSLITGLWPLLLGAFSALSTSIGAILPVIAPVIAVVAGLTLVVMGIRKAFERAGLGLDSFSGLLDGLWTVLKIVWNVLKPVVNLFTDLIAFCLRPLVWALKQVISGLKAFFDFLKDSYNWLADSFVGRNMGLEKMVDAPAPVPATSEERYRQALEAGHPKATPWQDPNAPGELWTPQRLESLDRAATGGQPGGVVPMAVSGPPDPQLMGVFNSINDRLKTLVELFQKGIPITGSVSLADRSLTTFMDTVSAAAMTTTGKGVTADVNVKPLETVDRRLKEIGADLPPPVAMLKAMGRMYTWLGEYSRVMAHWINLGQTFSTAANTYVKEILPVVSTGMAGISDSVKKFADAISAEMQKVKTSVTTLEKATLEQMVGQVTELGKALERIAAGKLPNVADIKAGMDRLVVWAAGVRTVLRAVTEVPTSRFAAEGLTHGFRYVLDQLKATLDGIQIDVDKQVVPLAAQVADIIKKLDQVVGANLPDASDVRTRLQFLTGWAAEIRNALRAVVEVPTGRFAAEGLAPGFRYAVDELQRNIDAIALSLKPLDLTKLNVIKAFDADVVSRLPSKELLLRSWGRVRDYVRGVADLLPTIAEQMAALKASTVAAQERAATIGCDFRAMTDGLRKAFSFLDPTVLAGLGSSLRADALAALPTRNEMTGIFTAIMARIQSLASAMPELLDRFKQSLAQMKSGIAAGLEMGPQFRSLVNEFKTAFSFLDLSAFRSLGQVWGVGPGLALPSPDSLLRTFEFIRDWMMEVVGLMDKRLRPMVRDMRETITDSILKRGKEMAASLQTMVGGVGSIFSAIKLAGLEEVFQRMGKSLSKSLPPAESLEDMFGYLRTWMRTVIQKVLPKMAAITDEATGELSVAIADGVVKSQDLGRVIGELGTLFDKTNVSRLHQSVKDFVRSFRTPLPDAEEISDHLTGLIEWVKNLFGTTSPFSGLSDGLTAIQTQAAEFVRAANQFGDALNTVRQIFDKMNPGDALSAWRQLARRAAGKMPDASEIREVVGRIRQFVQDTGTVFPAVGQSITPPPQTVSPTIGRPLGTPAVSTGGLPAPIPGSLYVHDIHVDRLLNAAMPTIAVGSPQVTGLDSMPANVEPTAVAPTVAEPVPMGLEAVESRIEQQLASAEPSPAIALATQHLNEIAANTRNTAEGVRAVNSTLANILAVLGGGGKGGSAADADTRTNDMPTSTPIWPRLMYNANGGARKRYLQVGV